MPVFLTLKKTILFSCMKGIMGFRYCRCQCIFVLITFFYCSTSYGCHCIFAAIVVVIFIVIFVVVVLITKCGNSRIIQTCFHLFNLQIQFVHLPACLCSCAAWHANNNHFSVKDSYVFFIHINISLKLLLTTLALLLNTVFYGCSSTSLN